MDFEKIRLALVLKGIELRVIGGNGNGYVGYMMYTGTTNYMGDKLIVRDSNGVKVVRVGRTKFDVADKLYKWALSNGKSLKEME